MKGKKGATSKQGNKATSKNKKKKKKAPKAKAEL
jgi:hypothetical protein